MMLDADVVAVGPTGVWRMLGEAGLLRRQTARKEAEKLTPENGLPSANRRRILLKSGATEAGFASQQPAEG